MLLLPVIRRHPIGLDAAVGGDDDPAETFAFGASIRLVIFTSMGNSQQVCIYFRITPCASVKLVEREEVRWSGRRDLNPRPSAPKADALPGCATPRYLFDCSANRIPIGLRRRVKGLGVQSRSLPLQPGNQQQPATGHSNHRHRRGQQQFRSSPASLGKSRIDATIDRVHGGCSSAAERLTVAQDVVGSIPTSRPNMSLQVDGSRGPESFSSLPGNLRDASQPCVADACRASGVAHLF